VAENRLYENALHHLSEYIKEKGADFNIEISPF
ncbi:MAG: hypothetical protein JWR38_4984, partial [Mucilaginibacter sp.]|nr:hypothetical protein [Mucilaginibacter sp.]MDN5286727.1 hypothetical protein [Mucilaginibacter sp.]MDN5287226.1 hypothetical protein [Mucilaginibacter sp.]MDN5288710.1 hypothetical protein [Mucilaginibacter sp.]